MKFIFGSIIIVFSLTLKAQSIPLSHFSFQHGVSVPLFDYASKNFHSGTYAKTGGFTTLNYTHYKKNIGWTMSIGGGNQKMNATAFNNELQKQGIQARANDSSQWMSSIAMAGPSWAKYLGKWTFEGAFIAGFLFGKSPSMTVYGRSTLNEDAWKYYNYLWQCVAGIGFQTKGQVKYQCGKHWALSTGVSVYGGKLKYKTATESVPELNLPAETKFYPIKVSVFTATLGLHYNFRSYKKV
jgi:hypothetical protein